MLKQFKTTMCQHWPTSSCEKHKLAGKKSRTEAKENLRPTIKCAASKHSDRSVRGTTRHASAQKHNTTTNVPSAKLKRKAFLKAWQQASKSECGRRTTKKKGAGQFSEPVCKSATWPAGEWIQYLSPFLGRVFLPQCGPLWERNTSEEENKGSKEARKHVWLHLSTTTKLYYF